MRGHDETRALAEAMLAFRLSRSVEFPTGMFNEAGWEFLLVLLIADADGRRITGREVCRRLDAAPAVCSRWLKYLASEGFVVGDGAGDLDDELTMAPVALERMERLLDHAKALRSALLPDRRRRG